MPAARGTTSADDDTRPRAGRSRRNVTQACYNCRSRKKKCDGQQPCSTCVFYKDECVWSNRDDWRKPLSKTEANALRSRVEDLEREVEEYRQKLADALGSQSHPSQVWVSSQSQPQATSGPTPQPASSASPSFERCFAVDAQRIPDIGPANPATVVRDEDDVEELMVQDDRGYLSVHNPTSAFHHASGKSSSARTAHAPRSVRRLANDTDPRRFARFLPDVYLTKLQHDTAVDRFFRYFASFGQRATPHLFYRDMEIALGIEDEADLPLVAPNYSPLTHNIIIALGLAYAEEEHLRAVSTRRMFMDQANKHLERELGAPCIATVQALTLRSSFPSTAGDYSVGWINSGLAVRMCFALGLHVDTSALVARRKLTHEAWVQRNVTFWSTFAQEEMWAIYIGRTPLMPLMDSHSSCPPPVADPVTDNTVWTWPPGPLESTPPQPSYLSLTFVHTVSLMQIATEITNTVYSGSFHKADLVENGTVQRFRDALDDWLRTLPSEISLDPASSAAALPHIIMLNQGWAWILILLFQPFSQVSTRSPQRVQDNADFGVYAMTQCHQAAITIHQLAGLYRAQHGLRFTPPTMAQIIYTAGTTFLLAAAQAVLPSQVAASLDKARSCLEMLREIGSSWESGHQKAIILEELYKEYTHASVDITGIAGGMGSSWTSRQGEHQPGNTESDALAVTLPSMHAQDPLPAADEPPAFDSMAWSGDQSLDQFIQTLFSQNTLPIGSIDIDLVALLNEAAP